MEYHEESHESRESSLPEPFKVFGVTINQDLIKGCVIYMKDHIRCPPEDDDSQLWMRIRAVAQGNGASMLKSDGDSTVIANALELVLQYLRRETVYSKREVNNLMPIIEKLRTKERV